LKIEVGSSMKGIHNTSVAADQQFDIRSNDVNTT
jgi:hypothetical protein